MKKVVLRVTAAIMCFVCLLSNVAFADTVKEPEYLSYYRPRIYTAEFTLDKVCECKAKQKAKGNGYSLYSVFKD